MVEVKTSELLFNEAWRINTGSMENSVTQDTQGHSIDPFRIRCVTSVPLGKGTKFALRHRKMLTTKRCAIQILHISMFQFTFKCGYNYFISKYTDINSLHVTQIDLLHNYTFCSTGFARFRCKKGSLCVNSVMILVVLSTHAKLALRGAHIGKRENCTYCRMNTPCRTLHGGLLHSNLFYLHQVWLIH